MAVQHVEKDILELTKALIRIPSTNSRPEKISACTDFITQWLNRHEISYYLSIGNIPYTIWGANGESSQLTVDKHIVLDSLYGLFDSLDSFLLEIAQT